MKSAPKTSVVHARLDADTQRMLAELRKQRGERDSAIIREAIQALHARERPTERPSIVGLGAFAAPRTTDLATNKTHLKGLGRP